MIKVECPSCTAPYELDERRLPQNGLKMRCPKCGASFRVHPSGETGPADAPHAVSDAPARPPKKTMLGVAPPKPAVDAPAKPAVAAPPKPAPPKPAAPHVAGIGGPSAPQAYRPGKPAAPPKLADDPDLPAPKARPMSPFAASARRAPAPTLDEEVDLPAPKPAQRKAPLAPPFEAPRAAPEEIDLPARKTAGRPAPAPRERAPIAPAFTPHQSPPPARPLKPTEPEESFAGLELDVDLPAPKHASGGADTGMELDLPAPKRHAPRPALGGEVDLPVAKASPRSAANRPTAPELDDLEADLDLPKPAGGGGFRDLDLPKPRSAQAAPALDDLDLPMPKSTAGGLDDLDLPVPKGVADLPARKGGSAYDELDLPVPKNIEDLPRPKSAGGFDDLDLPLPKGISDLPAPKGGGDLGDLDLPLPKGHGDLPAPKAGGFELDLDLPVEKGAGDLPVAKSPDSLRGLDLPVSRRGADLPAARARDEASFDELELPEPPSGIGDELELPPARAERTADGRAGAGGVGFGEIDFGEEADDMEFGDLPEERPSAPEAQRAAASREAIGVATEAPAGRTRALVDRIDRPAPPRPQRRRGMRALGFVAVLLVLLVVAGVAAGMFTHYGYFGMYALEQLLPEAGDEASAQRVISEAEETASSDRYVDVRASLSTLAAARRKTGLNRRLLARSLVHESLYRVRFGEDGASEGRAVGILQRLESRGGDAPGMALARAAHALATGNAAQARSLVGAARAQAGQDPYVDLVEGEAALAADDPEGAVAAFERAAQKNGGARAHWGLARAKMRGAGLSEAAEAIEATLAASPRHSEALAAKAALSLEAGDVAAATELARQAAGADPLDGELLAPSPNAKAMAWTLLGRIHEQTGNRTRAREAYDAALAADPYRVSALIGAGRVLLTDARYRDALARFEAVIASGETESIDQSFARPVQAEAKLGAARAMIHLDRVQDAKVALEQLAAELPEDAEVALWLGKAQEALGDGGAAERHYREAVRLSPDHFDGYLALAQLFFASERPGDAVAVLNEAQRRVEETAQVRRLLGESELARNNLDAAIRELRRALELDPDDTAALFGLGVAQRRAGRLEAAKETFAAVAERDAAWPGLSLERGMVFEALGQSDRAVEMYQKALEEQPEDTDLMLRLGAAYVAAGQIDRAEETLREVMQARPNSAEAEHFMGRVLLARGETDQAVHHFSRAVSLDPNRGEYWLYVGWAALEAGDLGRALESVEKAIELDPSLGDAYWLRGRIRVRTGAVRDARTDLERALTLKPSRHEAYAALGDAYDQLRRLNDAVRAYESAVERDGTRGDWWYRLGRLRLDAGSASAARQALERATTIGDAIAPQPGWLPDAHRLRAEAARLAGARQEAIEHYRKYLQIAPGSAIDREDVQRSLAELTR